LHETKIVIRIITSIDRIKVKIMLIIGFTLGTYIGFRLAEHYSHKPQEISIAVENDKYNFAISSVAMGLTVVSYFYPPVTFLAIGGIIYTTIPILRQAEQSLLTEKRIKNNLLSSIVTIMCLGIGSNFAAALQTWLYHFGSKIVSKSHDKSAQMITEVFAQQPNKVWILKNSIEIEVPIETLQINDIIIIQTGEVIPIDGTIISGIAMVDQNALTGESMPVEKIINDNVFASTIVVRGQINIKVEKTGVETTVAELAEILHQTTDFKTNLQLKGEGWSNKIAAPLLAISTLSLPILGVSSATTMLFSAPTNSIMVFPSLQTYNYLALISSKGILVKDGRVLEDIPKIDTILFDKTGTLTHEKLTVGQIILTGELEENEVLAYAASAERRLNHPIAQAIFTEAETRNLNLPTIAEADYKIGYGITVTIDDQVVKVGSARFMTMEGIALQSEYPPSYSLVSVNNQVQGAIETKPQVRAETKDIIKKLRQRGIKKIYIVSGDHEQTTKELSKELDMDGYFAEVLPDDKAKLVTRLQQEGNNVCFVGDGINDIIAMKKANVSISLCGASSIATDMAQIVLMDGSLSHLCDVFDTATELNNDLQNSLFFWTSYGVGNFAAASIFRFGITGSTIIYGIAFSLGIGKAMLITKDKD